MIKLTDVQSLRLEITTCNKYDRIQYYSASLSPEQWQFILDEVNPILTLHQAQKLQQARKQNLTLNQKLGVQQSAQDLGDVENPQDLENGQLFGNFKQSQANQNLNAGLNTSYDLNANLNAKDHQDQKTPQTSTLNGELYA